MRGDHRARIAALHDRLGDAADPANPVGDRAILAADEREGVLHEGESLLEDFGFNAEFVPEALGGRMTQLDRTIQVIRAVCRRDLALGFGYSGSTFIGTTNIWTAGAPAQQAQVAQLLLANGRITTAYHELAHGNDLLRVEFTATRATAEHLVLNGRKEVLTGARRADALIVFARTGREPGPRSHSQILVDLRVDRGTAVRHLPRFHSAGMRSVQLGGVEFDDCTVPVGQIVGRMGDGMATAMRAFQISRTALPAMACASLDTGLRTAMSFAQDRHLGGRPCADLPLSRRVLSDAFVDLLICDAFSSTAARALHLLPREGSIYAAAVKYLVSRRLLGAMRSLSTLLGAGFYLREGPYALFQKHLRDIVPASFGHIAPAACLASLVPQLMMVARRSWADPEVADPRLFQVDGDLPPLPFDRLTLSANGRDSVSAALLAERDELIAAAAGDETLRHAIGWFADELAAVRRAASDLPPGGGGPLPAASYELAARYARLLAASACVKVWHAHGGHGFLGEPGWLVAALSRLAEGALGDGAAVDRRVAAIWPELQLRHRDRRTFDLYREALC